MTNTGKIIATASTFGAIGGSSALAGYILNNRPTELENRLTQEGFEILDINNTNSDWNTVLTDYKNATKNTFAGNKQEQSKSEEELRNDCKKILRDRAFKETNYSLARQWCVKKAKANKILEKNYTILKTEGDADKKDNPSWTKLVEAVQKAPEKFKTLKDKIKHNEASNATNISELKKECKALKEKNTDTTAEEFGNVFDQMRDYCSVKKNDNN